MPSFLRAESNRYPAANNQKTPIDAAHTQGMIYNAGYGKNDRWNE